MNPKGVNKYAILLVRDFKEVRSNNRGHQSKELLWIRHQSMSNSEGIKLLESLSYPDMFQEFLPRLIYMLFLPFHVLI
jgi:hypothetical protein